MSNADKRSVSTDALETLGNIINEHQKRDAIHIAVEPVIAGERLSPGAHVGPRADGTWGTEAERHLGIVDPFLTANVRKGQRFWLLVYPRKITSLRHVWSHPDFSDPDPHAEQTAEAVSKRLTESAEKKASENWLRSYAAELPDGGATLENLLIHTKEHIEYGDYWSEGGRFEGISLPMEFWHHYEIYTGEKVEDGKKESFFSCSC